MQCDICGRQVRAYLTNMEGATLYVCDECNPSKEGRVKREFKDFRKFDKKPVDKSQTSLPRLIDRLNQKQKFFNKRPKTFAPRRYSGFQADDYDLIDNYGEVLRKAREEKGIKLEDFAKQIKEQASFLLKIEQGKLKPNDRIILKVHDVLNINLAKTVEEEPNEAGSESSQEKEEAKQVEPFTEISVNNKRKIVL